MRFRYSIDLRVEHLMYEARLCSVQDLARMVADKIERCDAYRTLSRGILEQVVAALRSGIQTQEEYVLILGKLYDWGDIALAGHKRTTPNTDPVDEDVSERMAWIQTTK